MDKKLQDTLEKTSSQMRKGILEFCILLILSKEPVYSNDIVKILKESDLVVVEGTLYPLLSRLRRSNLLSYEWQESKSGPPRKYYLITKEGELLLGELKKVWTGFSRSINSLIRKFK